MINQQPPGHAELPINKPAIAGFFWLEIWKRAKLGLRDGSELYNSRPSSLGHNFQRSTPLFMGPLGTFQVIFRAGGFKSYQLTAIIVNAVLKTIFGKALTFAGNQTLMQIMKVLTGPIGWAVTGIWAAVDIAGAAYRVTIPAVIQIAALRQMHLYADLAEEATFS